jgi:Penicillin amidase
MGIELEPRGQHPALAMAGGPGHIQPCAEVSEQLGAAGLRQRLGAAGDTELAVDLPGLGVLEEWRTAMRRGALPMFNSAYADREGNVSYVYNARLPRRNPGYDWSAYLPGDTSETLWNEYPTSGRPDPPPPKRLG